MSFVEKMRTFVLDGEKKGVRLDEGTWAVVDWLADQRGVKWAELAREWVMLGTHGPQAESNITKIIRSSALMELSNETIFNDRAEMHASAGPVWQSIGTNYRDEDVDQMLADAQRLDGQDVNFGGFYLSAGSSEHGLVTFYIRNAMKNQPHIIISTPFTEAQWAAAQGNDLA